MSDAAKVLLLFWGKRGGGSIFTYYLAEYLRQESEIDLRVSLRQDNDELRLFQSAEIPVFTLGLASLRRMVFRPWEVYAALKRHLRSLHRWQPSVAIVTMNSPFAWPLVNTLKARGCRIIYVAHDARPHPGDYAPHWQRFTQARLLKLADTVVTLSQFVADELKNEQPNLPIRPVPLDAVYPCRFSERKFPLQPGRLRFLVMGRLIRYKGFEVLLDAVKRLENTAGWSLTVAGHGPLQDEIETYFSKINDVELELKWLSDERMFELMATHDVLVCNYSEASQSGLIAQALSSGIPVLATRRGALPEQLGSGPTLLTDGSAIDLATKMRTLIDEPSRLRQLSEAERKLFTENKKQNIWVEIIRATATKQSIDNIADGIEG